MKQNKPNTTCGVAVVATQDKRTHPCVTLDDGSKTRPNQVPLSDYYIETKIKTNEWNPIQYTNKHNNKQLQWVKTNKQPVYIFTTRVC